MGLKVNLFMAFVALNAIAFYNLPCFFLFIALIGFCLVYSYWKNWQYLQKIPGGRGVSLRAFFENSSSAFHENLLRLWKEYGQDKFVVWIGFERFVTLSRFEDVKAVLTVSSDKPMAENYHAMWPWIGVDAVRGNDFECQAFTSVIMSRALNDFTKDVKFVEHMSRRFGALCKHNMSSGDTVDIQSLSRLMMFDILYVIGTGKNISDQRTELLNQTERLITMSDQRIYSGLMQSQIVRTITAEEYRFQSARTKISQIVSTHLRSNDAKAVAYSVYNDIQERYPDIDPTSLVETFILLGYDRFSIAFTNMIMELSKNPALQDEICVEIRKNQRNFMKSPKLREFLIRQLPQHPVITVVSKTTDDGVPLTGYFLPPSTNCLLYLQSIDSHGKLMEMKLNEDECMTMNLMKIFVGEFIVRFKFSMRESKSMRLGCGISLRRKGVDICVRNRY